MRAVYLVLFTALYTFAYGTNYQAVILHQSGDISSAANSIDDGIIVGSRITPQGNLRGVKWTGDSHNQEVLLDTYSAKLSRAYDIHQDSIVGFTLGSLGFQAALLENGTAESYKNLHPSGYATSFANAVHGNVQGGNASINLNGPTHAMIWRGSASSAEDLHPSGYVRSNIEDVYGDWQVGWAESSSSGNLHAILWNSTAEAAIDLTPTGYQRSEAYALTGTYQGGFVATTIAKAAIWHGSAESMEIVHPYGYYTSSIQDACEEFQVGSARLYSGETHAMIWQGTSESAIDLHAFLPDGYVDLACPFFMYQLL